MSGTGENVLKNLIQATVGNPDLDEFRDDLTAAYEQLGMLITFELRCGEPHKFTLL